jgi:hypothetical protein
MFQSLNKYSFIISEKSKKIGAISYSSLISYSPGYPLQVRHKTCAARHTEPAEGFTGLSTSIPQPIIIRL